MKTEMVTLERETKRRCAWWQHVPSPDGTSALAEEDVLAG